MVQKLAFSIGLLISVNCYADLFGDIVKVAKVAVNPVGAVHEEAAKKAAEVTGIANPEIVGKAVNPTGQVIEHAPKAVEHVVKTEVARFEGLVRAVKEGSVDGALMTEIKASVDRGVNPAVVEAAMPVFMLTALPFKDVYMEEPKFLIVNPGKYGGDSVVYVNGMLRDTKLATIEAEYLSDHLKRPVQLLLNDTHGPGLDFVESTVDRFGPLIIPGKAQFNATTKQLAHLFYHAGAPVSIVSHSQGSILVRNGLMIAETYKRIRQNVAWVTTGTPMKTEEIQPRPAKFRDIRNPGDKLVAQLIGLNFDPKTISDDRGLAEAHGFTTSYYHLISNDDLFGFGKEPNYEKARIEDRWAGRWKNAGECYVGFVENDEILLRNEKGAIAYGTLVNGSKTVRVVRGNWDLGLEGDLSDNELRWRNGSTWKRPEPEILSAKK